MIKKKDALILTGLVLLGIILTIAVFLPQSKPGAYVTLRQNGSIIKVLPLSSNTSFLIQTKSGEMNQLVIKEGKAYITSANCKDHLCTKGNGIWRIGESIVCLPHKLSIEITGETSEGPDAIVSWNHSLYSGYVRRFL